MMKRLIVLLLSFSILCLPVEARRRWVPRQASTANSLLTSLRSYWQMNAASGSGETDSKGANNLILNGTLTAGTGVLSGSRVDNGTLANYFSVTTDSNFSPGAGAFSCTFWARAASLSQTSFPCFVALDATSSESWVIYFDDPSDKPVFEVSTNGTTKTSVTASTAFAGTSSYVFIAAVWDGANIKISVNGGAFATTAFTGPVFSGVNAFRVFETSTSGNSWNGELCEMGYWNRALSIGEVGTLYNGGAGFPFSSFQ